MEDWTAEIAKNMFGDSLYQQRARAALPVLVRQATARQKITYTDLAQELDIPNPRNLNFVLGSVGTTLVELSDRWKEDVPAIQLIVVNQQTGMPGSGVDPMIDAAHVGKLDPRQKEALVDSIQARAFAYPRWSDVLRELGLPTSPMPDISLLDGEGHGRGGGEGEAHNLLKLEIAKHPALIGLSASLAPGTTEYRLPSGDVIDVLFQGRQRRIGVEVKSYISDSVDIVRGLFQCVKYLALLKALRTWEGKSYAVEVVLAIEGAFPKELVSLRNLLGVRVVESISIERSG
jgi:hypothetical protein